MSNKVLTVETMNQNVLRAKYAVRGAVPLRAFEIEGEMKKGKKFPFDEVIYCNIGNPQQLKQKPLTFFRQVLALVMYPDLIQDPEATKLFPAEAIARARQIVAATPGGVGAYSHSQGLPFVRDDVADFLTRRDGIKGDPNLVFLTNGASPGVQTMLQCLVRDHRDGILIPIPQYPLYSGTLDLQGGTLVPYELKEETGWQLEIPALAASVAKARADGINVRAMVIINPGNPTGQCLSLDNMVEVLNFCKQEHLLLMADEVYQTNIYQTGKPFVSFRKVLLEHPEFAGQELVSFHSCSKGFLGECGLRGGYYEVQNIDPAVRAEMYKLASLFLCPNVVGQIMVDLMVKPPTEGAAAELYQRESRGIIESLTRRAHSLSEALNSLPGVSCQPVEGAMYAFPKITLPRAFIEEAQHKGQAPDQLYCLALLEEAGLCTVPGSGFGQHEGTFHLRTTILPPEEKMASVVERFARFHRAFSAKYAN